jgi:hypothetical protein
MVFAEVAVGIVIAVMREQVWHTGVARQHFDELLVSATDIQLSDEPLKPR